MNIHDFQLLRLGDLVSITSGHGLSSGTYGIVTKTPLRKSGHVQLDVAGTDLLFLQDEVATVTQFPVTGKAMTATTFSTLKTGDVVRIVGGFKPTLHGQLFVLTHFDNGYRTWEAKISGGRRQALATNAKSFGFYDTDIELVALAPSAARTVTISAGTNLTGGSTSAPAPNQSGSGFWTTYGDAKLQLQKPAKKVLNPKYPHTCNRAGCGAPAYVGAYDVDCSRCGKH